MTIRCKAATAPLDPRTFFSATKNYVMLHTDKILEISETGCQVFGYN